MQVKIKLAKASDAESISNIYAASWKVAYRGMLPQKYLDELRSDFWTLAFHNWLDNNTLKAALFYENSVPVGCIAFGKSRDDRVANWGEIVALYIHPECFRKGYGQKLLRTALLAMNEEGFTNCFLWVLRENINARRFYEKNGFRCNYDEYKCEIAGELLTDLRYIIKLTV